MQQSDLPPSVPALSENDPKETESSKPAVELKIHRDQFKCCYSIEIELGKCFYAITDFQQRKRLSTLMLHESGEEATILGVSYMPWTSREIHLGFSGSDPLQGTHWEDIEKKRLPRGDVGQGEYSWTTHLPGGEKTARLTWVTDVIESMPSRSHSLLYSQEDVPVAEFIGKQTPFTGGTLKIWDSWEKEFNSWHLKVLLAFLSIYETGRRKAHRTVYRPSKGTYAHVAR